ncbi:MAG: tryptophan synthase subunit alpha [Candidatus Saccharibacteria bacterium]
MSLIKNTFKKLSDNNEQALIGFMMAGLPDNNLSLDCIKAAEQGGCDILELGVPFSDPVADGEIIERLHHRGVAMGLNLDNTLEFAAQVRQATEFPLILFCYFNPIFQRGVDRFMSELKDIGVSGVIVPDLPLDELETLRGYDIDAIPMVAPSSSEERMKLAGSFDPSFTYCVSVRGVTGVRSLPEQEIKDYLDRVRLHSQSPLALGFGISSPEQIQAFKGHTDAYVIGSHLAQIIEQNEAASASLPGRMEQAVARLKSATR